MLLNRELTWAGLEVVGDAAGGTVPSDGDRVFEEAVRSGDCVDSPIPWPIGGVQRVAVAAEALASSDDKQREVRDEAGNLGPLRALRGTVADNNSNKQCKSF